MISQREYKKHLTRIDELLQVVGNDTPLTDPAFIELNELSDLVADYEEVYHPVSKPGLIDVIRLRMTEMELNQKQLADLLETPTSRISEYLKGKRDITLDVARRLHQR